MSSGRRRTLAGLGSASPALLVALLPKCPACLGAYLAIASSLGLGKLDPSVLWAVMLAGLVLALALLGRAAARRRRWGAFAIACLGAAVLLVGRVEDAGRGPVVAGLVLLYAGALRIYLSRLNRTMGACRRRSEGVCRSS
jgi:hypothetical protein